MPSPLSRTLDALPDPIRYRVRNVVSLARWMTTSAAGGDVAYEDTFWSANEVGDWDGLASAILRYCPATSIVDVGCWDGRLLAAFQRQNPRLRLTGLDGSRPAVTRARERGLSVIHVDLAAPSSRERVDMRVALHGCDLAVCLETAEHLPPWRARELVRLLSAARMVVFSAAHPNQLGTLHMNEQPFEYWQRRFAEAGLTCPAEDVHLRQAIAGLDLPPWYAANLHLFTHTA
jgi:2-polyprenyl-3-methyl-5-hydroxy-6-metoxy-1,4-benzoquinol methylase